MMLFELLNEASGLVTADAVACVAADALSTLTLALAVEAGDVFVAVGMTDRDPNTMAWAGDDTATEHADVDAGSGQIGFYSGTVASTGTRDFAINFGGSDEHAIAVGVFR